MRPLLLAALLTALLGACRSAPPAPRPLKPAPDQRPDNFVLAATVFTPPALDPARLPRSLRPARYIIEADGVLRAATGAGAGVTTYPPQTRQLTERQFDGLWRQLRDTNLLNEDNPARIDGPESVVRSPEHTTALIYTAYGDRRATLRILLDRSGADAVAAERLIDRLAELAWIRD